MLWEISSYLKLNLLVINTAKAVLPTQGLHRQIDQGLINQGQSQGSDLCSTNGVSSMHTRLVVKEVKLTCWIFNQ